MMINPKQLVHKIFLVFFLLSAFLVLLPKTNFSQVKAACPITTNITATPSGNTINFTFTPPAGATTGIHIVNLATGAVIDHDVSGSPGYTTTLPDGQYSAVLQFGFCDISNVAGFTSGGLGASLNLNTPTTSGNTVTFSFSPAPANSMMSITGTISHTEFLAVGQTSFSWDGADGSYSAVIRDGSGTALSSIVTFSLPGTITPPGGGGGGAECTSFTGCTDIPNTKPTGFGDNTFITDLVSTFLPVAIGIGGFISVIIVVISGLQFITSNGNPEGAAAARGRLIFALVGFVLLTLAFAITKVIDALLLRGSGIF